MRMMMQLTIGLALIAPAGCTGVRYTTPGEPADMSVFREPDLARTWNRKPAANFPARLAVVRVQDSGYRSHDDAAFGYGRYSVVTTRDVESDEQLARIQQLDGIAGLAAVNRLLLSERLESDVPLREAAASLRADMLLLYTFDTNFHTDEKIPHAGLLTLGFMPDREVHVSTTASALLLDSRTGFVYGTTETTARDDQIANFWTDSEAIDDVRRRTEKKAFDQLVDEFVLLWPSVHRTHATSTASGS